MVVLPSSYYFGAEVHYIENWPLNEIGPEQKLASISKFCKIK